MDEEAIDLDLLKLNQEFEGEAPQEILRWSWETFAPRIAVSSSFQSQSVALLHMVSLIAPEMPVLFLDTGYHFPATLEFRDRLQAELGLNIQVLEPLMGHDGFRHQYGSLYMSNPDRCCYINKVEPMQRVLKDYKAWISGIRRDQTEKRSRTLILSRENSDIYKICPLANWTRNQLWQYIHDHDLPHHPLFNQGYRSIGCAPCTRPADDGEDERAGRWAGTSKTECGLHSNQNAPDEVAGDKHILEISSINDQTENK